MATVTASVRILTESRKAELAEALRSLPECVCAWRQRDGYARIRFSDVAECPHCTGYAVIQAEVFGEATDHQSQAWLKATGRL